MPYAPKTHQQTLQARLPRPRRRKTAERGYGGRWQKQRLAFLCRHPMCARRKDPGCRLLANEVDHIVPLSQGGADDESNWQALCKPCHSRKTAREDGGFGQ